MEQKQHNNPDAHTDTVIRTELANLYPGQSIEGKKYLIFASVTTHVVN